MPLGTAMPAGTGLRWHWLRAGERGSAAPRGSNDRAEDHNRAVERTAHFAINHKQARKALLGYLTKGIFCCISEGVSDMRLDNLSGRAGTIDIPKIP